MLSRVAASPCGGATQSVAQNERRKPRANKRRYVGSCNELGGLAAEVACNACRQTYSILQLKRVWFDEFVAG